MLSYNRFTSTFGQTQNNLKAAINGATPVTSVTALNDICQFKAFISRDKWIKMTVATESCFDACNIQIR